MLERIRFVFDDRIVELGFSESAGFRPTTTVLDYLRSLPNHKGAKEGCAEGDCGACTVVLAETGENGQLIYKTIDSCLVFLPMIHGKQLITVENLALTKEKKKILHPVQQMMVKHHGTQCGYCTPGMVMSLFGLYKNHQDPPRSTIEEALAGNLCRCTGYQSILEAAQEICSGNGKDHFSLYEPVVSGMLDEIRNSRETIVLSKGKQRYYKPFLLQEALHLRSTLPQATVICGSTDAALRQTKHKEILAEVLDISAVSELSFFEESESSYLFGAGLTIEQVRKIALDRLPAVYEMLTVFGGLQIRNIATLGGNLGSASPIGDTLPLLIALKAVICVASLKGERHLPIGEFITGYHMTALREDELIKAVVIPKLSPEEQLFAHKISKRRELDITTVSCAFRLRKEKETITEIILAFGGMAATPARAIRTEQFLTGKQWSQEVAEEAVSLLARDFSPITDTRAGAGYRAQAARNLLRMFLSGNASCLDTSNEPETKATSVATIDRGEENERHTTGESIFVDDIQNSRMLLGRVVYSREAHAVLRHVETAKALAVEGVRAILTAKDIPGENQMGPVVHDEPCLADGKVTFIGQAIALIAAETEEAALAAEKLITIAYEPLPAILDIRSAMAAGTFLSPLRTIARGDADTALKTAPHVLHGILETGAQEHWYLETQAALAIPGEGTEIKIEASTQNPTETQAIVAEVLGIGNNQVEVEVKRIGGGFGGKETQGNHVAAWAALLADATHRPVKVRLFRDDDQIMTGKRHRFLSEYEIGFDNEGQILAYRVALNGDAGSSADLSRAILERAMLHADNAYFIPAVTITGQVWKTNLPSNTAFRGFGGPQGMAVIENAIDRIARVLGQDAATIRQKNFYREGANDLTPYGQAVENFHLQKIFGQLAESSGYAQRRLEIDKFNARNCHFKKGIAFTPVKFGISFTTTHLNQAGALVNLYTDGTVIVNHGGTEMGQGLHAKIKRIASLELGISPDRIVIAATNTAKVPNTSPTAASSGSDLNGMAVKDAIDKLKRRLLPVAFSGLEERYPDVDLSQDRIIFHEDRVYDTEYPDRFITFASLCSQARLNQVSLSATGFYRTPGIYFDREKGSGQPFYYFACGMAVSEVKVDVMTGEYRLLRTDILHDTGDSISEPVDLGQIEGGFIQGMGWCTMEEIKWDDKGNLLTHSPDTYKIPTIGDIPRIFKVDLMKNVPNPGTIRRSKAVGEPPFMLGLSVWLAIKDAVSAVADHRVEPLLPIPATAEKVLLAIRSLNDNHRKP